MDNYKINQIQRDEFGRPSGILSVNKPKGKTSHDVVYDVRREYETKKVGHAGTLDPFAEGLLIVLIGKATKFSDQFLTLDKEYEADILFGVETKTGDIEEEITKNEERKTNKKIQVRSKKAEVRVEEMEKVFKSFQPEYRQFVPVYSSVKVGGDKLRVLARKFEKFETKQEAVSGRQQAVGNAGNGLARIVNFYDGDNLKKSVELPSKVVKIYDIELLDLSTYSKNEIKEKYFLYENFLKDFNELESKEFQIARIRISCSKGTYIRQLAVDIAERLGTRATLIALKRTRVGNIELT